MTALWTFLNSPLGITLVVSLLGKLFVATVKQKSRREKLLDCIGKAFEIAEMVGLRQGLKGGAKYLIFVEQVVQEMKAIGESAALSPEETILLENAARQRAWVDKLKKGD